MSTLFYHPLTYHICGIIYILYSYREKFGMVKTLTTLAGPPTGFWEPRALTRNEALDHTCGGHCVKHNYHTSWYY